MLPQMFEILRASSLTAEQIQTWIRCINTNQTQLPIRSLRMFPAKPMMKLTKPLSLKNRQFPRGSPLFKTRKRRKLHPQIANVKTRRVKFFLRRAWNAAQRSTRRRTFHPLRMLQKPQGRSALHERSTICRRAPRVIVRRTLSLLHHEPASPLARSETLTRSNGTRGFTKRSASKCSPRKQRPTRT